MTYTTNTHRIPTTTNYARSPRNRGQFPNDASVVKLLWLAICNIEDKRARERAKETGKPRNQRKAPGKLIEGSTTQGWPAALNELSLRYPERFNQTI